MSYNLLNYNDEVRTMNQSKKITDGALLTGIFIVLLLLQFFVPFLSMIVMFLLPVPFIMYAYKHDWKPSILVFILALIFSALLMSVVSIPFTFFVSFLSMIVMFLLPVPFIIYSYKHDWKPSILVFILALILSALLMSVVSIPFTVLAGFGGIMIGTAMNRNLSAYESWARGTVGFVIGLLLFLIIGQMVFQVHFVEEFNQMVQESFEMSSKTLEQFGLLDEATMDELEVVEEQILAMQNLLPVWLVVTALILALVSQWISYKIINRVDHQQFRFPPFHQLKFPILVFWIYFIAFFMVLIDMDQD